MGACVGVYIGWFIATAIWFEGMPHQWTINHEIVEDTSVFHGMYISVNERLKITPKEDTNLHKYHVWVLHEMVDGEWREVWRTYMSTHDTKQSLLGYLRKKYVRAKKKQKHFPLQKRTK
jgi:hypothetical protein